MALSGNQNAGISHFTKSLKISQKVRVFAAIHNNKCEGVSAKLSPKEKFLCMCTVQLLKNSSIAKGILHPDNLLQNVKF